jgi:hypothetical protein
VPFRQIAEAIGTGLGLLADIERGGYLAA